MWSDTKVESCQGNSEILWKSGSGRSGGSRQRYGFNEWTFPRSSGIRVQYTHTSPSGMPVVAFGSEPGRRWDNRHIFVPACCRHQRMMTPVLADVKLGELSLRVPHARSVSGSFTSAHRLTGDSLSPACRTSLDTCFFHSLSGHPNLRDFFCRSSSKALRCPATPPCSSVAEGQMACSGSMSNRQLHSANSCRR
jgi:hypothetical protein